MSEPRQPIAYVQRGDLEHERTVAVGARASPGALDGARAGPRGVPNTRGPRVAVYSRPAQHAAGVVRVLQCAYDMPTHADWSRFLEELPKVRGAVVFCPRLGRDVPLVALSAIVVHRPLMPWLVVTEGASDNLRLLVHIRATEAFCWGTDDRRIAAAVRQMLKLCHSDCLAEKFRHMLELPLPLRSAIAFVMAQASRAATDDEQFPVRSIRELAARVRQSEDALAAAARRHRVDPRSIIQWAVALWAIELHARGGTWEAVAWRLDYIAMSGLSDLFMRTVGRRPTTMPHRDIVEGSTHSSRHVHRMGTCT